MKQSRRQLVGKLLNSHAQNTYNCDIEKIYLRQHRSPRAPVNLQSLDKKVNSLVEDILSGKLDPKTHIRKASPAHQTSPIYIQQDVDKILLDSPKSAIKQYTRSKSRRNNVASPTSRIMYNSTEDDNSKRQITPKRNRSRR